MKKNSTFLAMMTGIIAVLVWAAPIGAMSHRPLLPPLVKNVVFEAQMPCFPAPMEDRCEDCGGKVKVFYDEGQAYVVFDFNATSEHGGETYHLYMGRNQIEWFAVEIATVQADGYGKCRTEPILLNDEVAQYFDDDGNLIPLGASMQVTFDAYSENHWIGGPPEDCGSWLSTGFWFEK